MRSRRGLRLILHAEQRQVPVPQAFKRIVVQVHVRELDFALWQRFRIDREIVIVGGDLDLSRLQLFHGMIAAMVPELQLKSLAAKRNSDELMPEADPENRLPPHQPPDAVDRISARLG